MDMKIHVLLAVGGQGTKKLLTMSSTTASSDAAAAAPQDRKPAAKKAPTLLEEVEEALAHSLLVFLVADLRLMSATGRVKTKYETIAIASDPPSRATAAQLAGLTEDVRTSASIRHQNEGLSPAQIMAVLLIELYRTVEARREREEEERDSQRRTKDAQDTEFKHDSFSTFEADNKTGQKKIRAQEEDMHSLLKAYADMIGQDLKAEIPSVEKRLSMLIRVNRPPSVRDPSSLQPSGLASVPEDEEMKEEEVDEEQGETEMVGTVRRIREPVQMMESRIGGAAEAIKKEIMEDEETKQHKKYAELTDALFGQDAPTKNLRQSLASSLSERKKYFTQAELIDFMEKALTSREYDRLDFMAGFFRDGTVSQLMVQSNARVVWMNDWYPLKDLTYAIAVDVEKQRILVVFRGAITRQDWSRAAESRNFRAVSNPIEEDYEGKSDPIAVASGFYQYLFRRRKDTGTSKYDEITNLACKYGQERIGENFKLVVTGHSLGAALSTVFSFFASAEERFTRNGPVKVFNFGSPYVGGHRFQNAFQHQEKVGKLQYARFFNHNDIVAHLPPNFAVTKYGGKFRHNGISVRLRSIPHGCCSFRKWHPDVFYAPQEGFLRSYWRAIRDNFLLKFPIPPWRFAEMHTLDELQRRLMFGRLRADSKEFALLLKPIDELYEELVGTEQQQPTSKASAPKSESK